MRLLRKFEEMMMKSSIQSLCLIPFLAKKFLFRVKIRPEKTWGWQLANGTWIGSVGSVSRGESQLGIGHISVQLDKFQVVDFTSMPYQVEYAHISNKPRPLDPFKNIVSPFHEYVWCGIVAAVAIVGATFAGLHYAYAKVVTPPHGHLRAYKHSFDFVFLTSSILVNQDRLKWFRGLPRASAGPILGL